MLPQEFLERMENMLGEEYPAFLKSYDIARYQALRLNPQKGDDASFLNRMVFSLERVPWAEHGYYYTAQDTPGKHPYHEAGVYYIQEPSAMAPAAYLTRQMADGAGERILDLCAAPGGKSTQIAAAMAGRGILISNEIHPARAKILSENVERMGIRNAAVLNESPDRLAERFPGFFDCIVVDAPCSGEGVVRKDPDALKNWSPESNQEIAATQRELIDSAFHALRPGGTLVYSTCTLNREENEAVCLWLKETYPDAVEFLPLGDLFPGANKALTEEGFLHVFPQIYDCEGFFVARLRKTQAIPALPAPKYKVGNFPFSPVKDREAGQIRQAAASVGLNWDGNLRLWQRDKELWLFPVGIEALIGKVRFSRLGIKLAETHNKGYRWQHEAVIALATPDNVNAFELTPQEAEEWYRGRDVYPQAAPVADDVLVTFQHQPIGLAKRIGSRLKNSYPRELVRDGKLFTGNA